MMRERCSIDRSAPFIVKLVDHHRTEGHAFLAEELLCDFIARGRRDLMIRLAELWFEFRNWPSVRELLWRLTPDQITASSLYMLGRSCAALKLEGEVLRVTEALAAFGEPGPRYAGLLRSVWDLAGGRCQRGDCVVSGWRISAAYRARRRCVACCVHRRPDRCLRPDFC